MEKLNKTFRKLYGIEVQHGKGWLLINMRFNHTQAAEVYAKWNYGNKATYRVVHVPDEIIQDVTDEN